MLICDSIVASAVGECVGSLSSKRGARPWAPPPLNIDINRLLNDVERAARRFRKDGEGVLAAELMVECIAPVPATRRIQFDAEKQPRIVPPGTPLVPSGESSSGVRWRTCFPVSVAPWNVMSASSSAGYRGYDWPDRIEPEVHSVLRLCLSSPGSGAGHDVVTLTPFGRPARTYALFQGALARSGAELCPQPRRPACAGQVLPLDREGRQRIVAGNRRASRGLALLTSLSLNPDALLALEISGLAQAGASDELELVFALRCPVPEVTAQLFRTRCTCALNAFPRAIPLFEIDPTRDEWPLLVPDGERVHALHVVEGYDPDTGDWPPHEGWRLVFRGSTGRRHAYIAFQDCLFSPQSPP